jgi:hypothetical protein
MCSGIVTRQEMKRITTMGDGEKMEEGEDLKLLNRYCGFFVPSCL